MAGRWRRPAGSARLVSVPEILPPDVVALAGRQAGVVARGQLVEQGVAAHVVRRWLRRRLLSPVHPGVYIDHTGAPSWRQRAWAAVLLAEPAALYGASALRAADGPGKREHRDEGPIHVAVDRTRWIVAPTGSVVVHAVPRLQERVRWNLGPPRQRYDDATIDVALATTHRVAAIGVLARSIQLGRTTAALLRENLEARPRVDGHDRTWLAAVLRDLEDGACSVLEQGYVDLVERPHGLPRADRQARATATSGVVYRDNDYGEVLVELDGRLFHDTAEARDADMERDLDAAVDGQDTRRLSYGQVFERPCTTAVKLGAILRSRGWQGEVRACGAACAVPNAAA